MIEDSFNSKEEFEKKIKKYRKSIRLRSNYKKLNINLEHNTDFELPPLEIIEELIDYFIENERNDEALIFCELWREYEANSLEAMTTQCSILNLLSRFNEVLILSDKILEEYPTCVEALISKAIATERLGQPDVAVEIASYALEFEPDNDDIIYIYAFMNKMAGNFEEAINYYNLFLEKNVSDTESDIIYNVQIDIISCYTELGEYDKAIQELEALTNIEPYHLTLWYSIGVIYNYQEKLSDAIEALEITLAIDDTFTPALTELANVYYKIKNYQKSIEYYELAQKISPQSIEIMKGLSEAYMSSENYSQAITILENMLLQNNNISYALEKISICKEQLKKTKKRKNKKI